MANYLKIYSGSVTSGAKNGVEVSSEHTLTNPLSVVLDSSKAESKCIKCAVRCETGFETSGTTTLSFMYWNGSSYVATGGAIDKFQIAKDNNYTEDNVASNATWGSTLNIEDTIGDTNVIFWVKISSTQGETPAKDDTVSLTAKGIVVAVE